MGAKSAIEWKLWNGYGPLTDGMMRVERIGPEERRNEPHRSGLTAGEGRDIVGSEEHLELVVDAVNSHALAVQLAEAVMGTKHSKYGLRLMAQKFLKETKNG